VQAMRPQQRPWLLGFPRNRLGGDSAQAMLGGLGGSPEYLSAAARGAGPMHFRHSFEPIKY
jgi:hypothetical protein